MAVGRVDAFRAGESESVVLTVGMYLVDQKSNGTIFLVEILVMPGQSDMTVTLKWIVNSLLYDNGHLVVMDILKYKMHQFFVQNHVTTTEHVQQTQASSRSAQPPQRSVGALAEEADGEMSARDYLMENPVVEPAKFEQLWANSPEMYVCVGCRLGCAAHTY